MPTSVKIREVLSLWQSGEVKISKGLKRERQKKSNNKRLFFALGTLSVVSLFFAAAFVGIRIMKQTESQGDEVLSFDGEVELIKINSFESSDCDGCDISATFDGFSEYPTFCRARHDWRKGTAYFSIPYSLVTHYILMVDHADDYWGGCEEWGSCDYYDYAPDAKIKFQVCNKEKNLCEPCEEPTHASNSKFKKYCGHTAQGAEGNEIRIIVPGTAPRVCEFEIYGIVGIKEAVRNLEVYESYGNRQIVDGEINTQRFSVTNAVDKFKSTEPFYCFASDLEKGGSATFDVPWSFITHIRLLNSDDTRSSLMGSLVSVCRNTPESPCLPCGIVPEVDKGSWTTIYCIASYIEGDRIVIMHAYNHLVICEIEIFGLQIELGVVTKVKIEEYRDNSDLRSDYEDYAPDRSYSHWLTNPDECWVSWTYEYTVEYYRDYSLVEANRASMEDSDYDYEYDYEYVPYQKRYLTVDAWQTYRMQLSVVHRIQILTCIHDGCDMQGLKIEYCGYFNEEYLCEPCGSFDEPTGKGELLTMYCNLTKRIETKELKVSRLEELRYCRIEVYGEVIDESTCHFWGWREDCPYNG